MKKDWNTQVILIERAQNGNDQQAWDEFVGFYESFIKMVLKKAQVYSYDEDDLLQTILLKIWKSLPKYEHNKKGAKFRTWMSTIIRNTTNDYYRKNKSEDNKKALLWKNRERFSKPCIEDAINSEWRNHVIRCSMEKVMTKFDGVAIEVFRLSLLDKSAREIAENLKLSEATVYTLRCRVKRCLKQEVSLLCNQ